MVWQMNGFYIRNIISIDLTKNHIFSVDKKPFLGGMPKLLQLYMGGYGQMITALHWGGTLHYDFTAFLASDQHSIFVYVFLCGAIITRFLANLETCSHYAFLGGYAQIITILHRWGGFPIYCSIIWGVGGCLSAPQICITL